MGEIQLHCGWFILAGRTLRKTFLKVEDSDCISRQLCGCGCSRDPRTRHLPSSSNPCPTSALPDWPSEHPNWALSLSGLQNLVSSRYLMKADHAYE